jgi:hypothetical protein
LDALASDEPEYGEVAELVTSSVIPRLTKLVQSADPLLAAKATYLASLSETGDVEGVILAAANRDEPMVRVAAAAAIGNAEEHHPRMVGGPEADAIERDQTLEALLNDPDPGVRRRASQSKRAMEGHSASQLGA